MDNFRTYAPAYGDVSQVHNGVDFNVSARLRGGLQVQGGTSTGQQVTDSCGVRDALPEQVSGGVLTGRNSLQPHESRTVTTRPASRPARLPPVHIVPRADVQLGFAFTSSPGVPLQANWDVPSAIAALSLGRPLSGNAPNVSVNLLAPDQMRSPRVNILDFRVGKLLRFGNTRANIALDLYNMLNLDTVITQNFNYVPNGAWLVPNEVLTARTAKLTLSTTSDHEGRRPRRTRSGKPLRHEDHEDQDTGSRRPPRLERQRRPARPSRNLSTSRPSSGKFPTLISAYQSLTKRYARWQRRHLHVS